MWVVENYDAIFCLLALLFIAQTQGSFQHSPCADSVGMFLYFMAYGPPS